MELDDFDRKILRLVQSDNRRTNTEIAQAVHLSEPSVRRRLDRLRKAGVIRAEVALLDRERLGVTLIVTITFKDDSPEAYRAFGDRMRAEACVSECYSIAGPSDFVVIAHAPNLPEFERWAHTAIMSDAAIQRYDTAVVYSTVKYETAIPV